jgi:hypothetical protein
LTDFAKRIRQFIPAEVVPPEDGNRLQGNPPLCKESGCSARERPGKQPLHGKAAVLP